MPRWKYDARTPLAKLRANAGLSMEYAASRLSIVMMTLYRYEHSITDIPLGIAENMTSLYKVSFDDLRKAAKETKELKGAKPEGRIKQHKLKQGDNNDQ